MSALLGGVLIGLAASMLLSTLGRVAGISGILVRLFSSSDDRLWRISFLVGFFIMGLSVGIFRPEALQAPVADNTILVVAGLLVGFGSILGNGCTSGHGVCGVGRFSIRSIVATLVFIFFGAATVFLIRAVLEGN